MKKKLDKKLSKEKVEGVLDSFFMILNALRKKLQKIKLGLILFVTGMLGCFVSVIFLGLEKISVFLPLFITSFIVGGYGEYKAWDEGDLNNDC